MIKVIISGGPCTGKTTLIEGLRDDLSSVHFIEEPATLVIESEKEKEKLIEGYTGKFPWNNYRGFGPLVIQKSVELENPTYKNKKISIQDRSLIDTIAYARLNNCQHLIPIVHELIEQAGYNTAFICEPLNFYNQTENRAETKDGALNTHKEICRAYQESRLKVHYLPQVDLESRLSLVKNILKL